MAATPPLLSLGLRVTISGLVGAAHLNDAQGSLVGPVPPTTDRLLVLLDSPAPGTAPDAIVSVRRERLTATPRPPVVPPPPLKMCCVCGAYGAALRCGACNTAAYCGKKCQRTSWRGGHREACAASVRLAETALVPAAMRGDVTAVVAAIEGGAAIDWLPHLQNPAKAGELFGGTALHHAAFNSHADVVRALVARGANLEVRSRSARSTALLLAVWGPDTGVVYELCRAGADVDARSTIDGWRALDFVAMSGAHEMTRTLLDHGAEVNAVDDTGDSLQFRCDAFAVMQPVLRAKIDVTPASRVASEYLIHALDSAGDTVDILSSAGGVRVSGGVLSTAGTTTHGMADHRSAMVATRVVLLLNLAMSAPSSAT